MIRTLSTRLGLALGALFALAAGGLHAAGLPTAEISIEDSAGQRHRFTVELATTEQSRKLGLMFRDGLPPDGGMLFDFQDEGEVSMWMQNTFFPLDMIFIDHAGRIVHIAHSLPPLSSDRVPSVFPVRAVLEVNGGTTESLGIRPGNRVIHPIFASGNGGLAVTAGPAGPH